MLASSPVPIKAEFAKVKTMKCRWKLRAKQIISVVVWHLALVMLILLRKKSKELYKGTLLEKAKETKPLSWEFLTTNKAKVPTLQFVVLI